MQILTKEGKISIYKDDEESEYVLHDLLVYEPYRRNGHGSALIRGAIDFINREKVRHLTSHFKIRLIAYSSENISKDDLVEFYTKNGFVLDDESDVLMYYSPTNNQG